MSSDEIRQIIKRLETNDADSIMQGLVDIEKRMGELTDQELADVVSAVNAIFYFDTYEYPQLQVVVDRAIKTLSCAGERIIPLLLRLLGDSDFKVEFHYALIFGNIGVPALKPLLEAYPYHTNPTERTFLVYSLGKIRGPESKLALPLVMNELKSPHKEIRDSSARTLGKIVENVEASELDSDTRAQLFDGLLRAASDSHPGVRAKACRSLGKMAKRKYLGADHLGRLKARIDAILGKGEGNWDDAFVVRKEATEVEEIVNRVMLGR